MPTIVKAGSAIAGMEVSSSNDGLLVFRTSAAGGGSVVDALSIAVDGKVTLPFALTASEIITAAKGIAFPATQVASADANTLDDYEEGTWTPGQGSGLTVSGSFSSSGKYTKVGRAVTVTGQVSGGTSVALGAGGQLCTGLPFSQAETEAPYGTVVLNSAVGGGTAFVLTLAITGGTAISAVSNIKFTVSYFV